MIGISASARGRRLRRLLTLGAGLATVLATAAVAAATAGGAPTATAAATADMSVLKSVNRNPARVGDRLTYEVLVTNNGPGVATNVLGADRLPPEVKFESATVSKGGPCFVTSLVQCPIGEMGSGETQTMTIVVTLVEEPFEGIFITNFASVFSDDDPDDSNDHTEHKTEVVEGGGGGGGGDEPCIPEAAFTDVDSMKNFLRKTIKRVKKGELSRKQLNKRTKVIDETKLAMLRKHFPRVFGVKFVTLFRQLEGIDGEMREVRVLLGITKFGAFQFNLEQTLGRLKTAQKELKDLEAVLQDGEGVPEAAFTEVDSMKSFLRKTIKRVKDGELSRKQLNKRTKVIDETKLAMLRAHFGSVCGEKYVTLFRQLEGIDGEMREVRVLLGITKFGAFQFNLEQTLGRLKTAQKELKDLEAVLAGAE